MPPMYWISSKSWIKPKKPLNKALAQPQKNVEGFIHYNLGNVAFTAQQFDSAISQYESALRIDPTDMEAKYNLELALKQQQQQQDQQDQQQDSKEGQQDQQQQQDSKDCQQDQQQQDQNMSSRTNNNRTRKDCQQDQQQQDQKDGQQDQQRQDQKDCQQDQQNQQGIENM